MRSSHPLVQAGWAKSIARDTQLNRDVALKVLAAPVASDTERLARFEREAHMLASLNHPNIAQIYGVERSGRTLAIIMEYVDGAILVVTRRTLAGGDDSIRFARRPDPA